MQSGRTSILQYGTDGKSVLPSVHLIARMRHVTDGKFVLPLVSTHR